MEPLHLCKYLYLLFIILNDFQRDNHALMSFLLVLDLALTVVLFGFNAWNWFLAFSGLSTIEFMSQASGAKTDGFDYSFNRVRDNLFKVFGTKSYFAVLSPSMRNNAFTGLEWSFQMVDLGFDEQGVLIKDLDEELGLQVVELENIADNKTKTGRPTTSS
jgi:hypothetical protein